MSAKILHLLPMDQAPNRIREVRMRAGKSQQALADAIGVSKMTISDLERGNVRLDVEYMKKIARYFGIDPADLLSEEDNPWALSEEERELIERYRSASDAQREQVQRVAEVIVPWRGRDAA